MTNTRTARIPSTPATRVTRSLPTWLYQRELAEKMAARGLVWSVKANAWVQVSK